MDGSCKIMFFAIEFVLCTYLFALDTPAKPPCVSLYNFHSMPLKMASVNERDIPIMIELDISCPFEQSIRNMNMYCCNMFIHNVFSLFIPPM